MQVRKQQLELDMEQQTASNISLACYGSWGHRVSHDQATEKQQLVFTLVFSCLELAENQQGCIFSPCLFNLYAEYLMRNVALEEAQTGIKIGGRNINNLRYMDDITLMAESEEELKSLLMKVKEESEKSGLKLNIQKMKIMASGPITSWQIDGKTMETVTDFIFLVSKIMQDGDCSHGIKRRLLLG